MQSGSVGQFSYDFADVLAILGEFDDFRRPQISQIEIRILSPYRGDDPDAVPLRKLQSDRCYRAIRCRDKSHCPGCAFDSASKSQAVIRFMN